MMFKSGYSVRIFKVLEDDLVDFFNYIPIEYYPNEESQNIYSPKLAELLIRIGSQVDIFFRHWGVVHNVYNKTHTNNLKIDNLNFGNYKDIEKSGELILSSKKIEILLKNENINPFEFWIDNGYPLWWTAYNKLKHHGFTYRKMGNLFNVIEALSALFLLNCVNNDSKSKLTEYGYGNVTEKEYKDMKKNHGFSSEPYFRSQLFEYEEESNIVSYSIF